jgi:hypothetical protein
MAHSTSNNLADENATKEELQAVLSGNIKPISIPVTVEIPPGSPHIMMTSPQRAPMTGVVKMAVSHNTEAPRGVSVQIQGALGMELSQDTMEEICRRGGAFSLPSRVWKASV